MSASVITIAQQKGGAGKTTLAVHLATTLAHMGYQVALVDIDPQGSLSAWRQMRQEAEHRNLVPLEIRDVTGWRLANEVRRLKDDFDIVIVDSPPHAETEARIAVRAADLVLIPVQPSPMDLWATAPTLALAKEEGIAPLLVLNRVPPNTNLTGLIVEALDKLEAPVAPGTVGNRVAYAASIMEGKGIAEYESSGLALEELRNLCRSVLKALKVPAKAKKKVA